MAREIVFGALLVAAAVIAPAQSQQAAPAAPAGATTFPDADLTIHYKGPGVIAPELLSINGKFDDIDHCKKLDGEVQILIAVDRTGTAQTNKALKTLGNDLDRMAGHIADLDKFKPGMVDGAPGIVAVADDIKLQACRMEKKDENGHKENYVQLRSEPEQRFELIEAPKDALIELPPAPGTSSWNTAMKMNIYRVGGGVSAPVLIHWADPQFTPEARNAKYQGFCIVSIIVDVNGNPQSPRVVRPLGMGLDEEALKAVKQFRFKPALKDGKTPVPVMITTEVNFRLY